MSFLKSIYFRDEAALPAGFPFDVPAIESLSEMTFSTPVTFFVGENGSGKSTLLEAIASGMRCPAVGSADVSADPSLMHARHLADQLRFTRTTKPRVKLFFRAEDAIGFTRRVNADMQELESMEAHYNESLSGYARDLATGVVKGQKSALSNRYGEDADARSHGEWFIHVIRERIHQPGLYLLDEPETPLSPIHQLTLLSILMETAALGAQFVIATHSPILMALPGATIISFDEHPPAAIAWEDVEHVSLTRAFLNDPESFIRHL